MADQPSYASTDFSSDPPTTANSQSNPSSGVEGSNASSPTSLPHKHHHHHHHHSKDQGDDLAGWGKSAERFGGMAHAAPGESEPALAAHGLLPDDASGRSFSSTSTSTGSESLSGDDDDDDESTDDERREGERPAKAYSKEFRTRQAQSLGDVKAREQENREELGRAQLAKGGQSKSYYGGSGQNYLRFAFLAAHLLLSY
jgi:hypothetical protein